MRRWWILMLLVAAWFFGKDAVNAVVDLTKRGRRLNTSTATDRGVVLEGPTELAGQAAAVVGRPVEEQAIALARMVRSEAGSYGPDHKVALAWVAKNDAADLGWDLLATLIYHRDSERAGRFGRQISGRYATGSDPYENDLSIAEGVIAGDFPDPTGGAVKFVHRGSFGVQEGTRTFEAVAADWATEGLYPFTIPNTSDLVLFRRGRAIEGVG